jgi:hypothetical protein
VHLDSAFLGTRSVHPNFKHPHHPGGDSVTRTERSDQSPSSSKGLFAALCASTSANGSAAPKITSRARLPLAVLFALTALALTAAPALAAPPEKPEALPPTEVKATTASLEGILSPKAPGEPASFYRYIYKASKAKICTGGSETEAHIAAGAEHEVLPSEPVTGLTAGTEYAVCLVAENMAQTERTSSTAVTFLTATPPEKPVTATPAKSITATTATLEGTVNPVKEAVTGYFFAWAATGKCSEAGEGGTSTPVAPAKLKAFKASVSATGLQPNRRYEFCLVATNEAGEQTPGNEVSVTTLPAPPEVIGESVSDVKSSEVTFEGSVNANNQLTECHFDYGVLSVTENEVACTPELLKGFGGQEVTPKAPNEKGELVPAPVGGLTPGAVYDYRIVTKNGKGEEGLGLEQHFQAFEAPDIEAPVEVSKTAWELHGVVDPSNARGEEPGTYEFAYRQSAGECQFLISPAEEQQLEKEGRFTELEADRAKQAEDKYTTQEPASGEQGQAVEAEVPGLLPGAPYTACLLVRNGAGNQAAISGQETFTTVPAPPTIAGESVSRIEEAAATLEAEVVPEGAATTTHFEYLTQAQYEADGNTFGAHTEPTTESEPIGSDDTTHPATPAQIKELTAGTVYRYRVVATNECEPGKQCVTDGGGKTFTTLEAPSTAPETCPNAARRAEQPASQDLPDCRAYEMVSPADTGGADATETVMPPGQVRAAAEGPAEGAAITYSAYGLFGEPVGGQLEDQLLSRRSEKEGRWETRSIIAASEHPNGTAPLGYVGMFFTPGLTEGLTTTAAAGLSPEAVEGLQELYRVGLKDGPGPYQLVSNLPGTQEEKEYARPYQIYGGGVYPLGASSDLTHVVFATEKDPSTGPLREWVNGRVVVVGVSNEGEVWPEAEVGPQHTEASLVSGVADVWRAVSEDGSRVVFTRPNGELYARVNVGSEAEPEPKREQSHMNGEECLEPAKACTVKLSAGATYLGASTDDSKIFYLENHDLYEYELPIGSVKGQVRALTAGGEVQGVVQISEDGSYVYFVADARLAAGAVEGQPNLYVSHAAGEPKLIATLSTGDRSDWKEGPGADSGIVAPGAAGGARLAFTSGQSLTGYDNRDAVSGQPDTEVYLYDAETGALTCASCNPSGARPVGSASLATGKYSGIGGSGASNYRPRDLLAGGELFFDSRDALVAHSSGGVQSVYEYEAGHVYPISEPAGRYDSRFLDASADGTDVFFATSDQLLPKDTSTNVAVYDARAGGGFPLPAVTPPCAGAASCEPPASSRPAIYGSSGTGAFNGPGNAKPTSPPPPKPKTAAQLRAEKLAKALKTCRKKHNKHNRQLCEKQARKKYGAKASAKKSTTRATSDRRAGR